jgi:hypothetical protein
MAVAAAYRSSPRRYPAGQPFTETIQGSFDKVRRVLALLVAYGERVLSLSVGPVL